jgi:uncharacterized protein
MSRSYPKNSSHLSNVLTSPRHLPKRRRKRNQSWPIRRSRLTYLRLIRLRGKPKAIATGLAMGVFAGFFPFLGLQTLIGVFLAALFKGSKVAAAAATWVSNPLTYVPIFVFNYKVGKLLLRTEETRAIVPLDFNSLESFRELGFSFVLTLLTGCVVVGAIAAGLTYIYSLRMIERLRQRRRRKKRGIDYSPRMNAGDSPGVKRFGLH